MFLSINFKVPYWLFVSGIELSYEPLVYPLPLYSKTTLKNEPENEAKDWLKLEVTGIPVDLNLNSIELNEELFIPNGILFIK